MEVAQPGLGPGGVDLAHVLALVTPLHVPDKSIFRFFKFLFYEDKLYLFRRTYISLLVDF